MGCTLLVTKGRSVLPPHQTHFRRTTGNEQLEDCQASHHLLSLRFAEGLLRLVLSPRGMGPWRGTKGLQTGYSWVPAGLLGAGGTIPNASTPYSSWHYTRHMQASHLPRVRCVLRGVRLSGRAVPRKPHSPWGTVLLLTMPWHR